MFELPQESKGSQNAFRVLLAFVGYLRLGCSVTELLVLTVDIWFT
jgi:hypothetical protein